MNSPILRPRHLVALFIGLGSASLLSALLVKTGARFPMTPAEPQYIVSTGTVHEGDVFAVILSKNSIPPAIGSRIEKTLAPLFNPRFIQPGHNYEVVTSTSGEFRKFIYKLDAIQSYQVMRSSQDVYTSAKNIRQTMWVPKRVKGEVTSFLEKSLTDQGLDNNFVNCLTWHLSERIFAWRIDFYTEQRKGDTYDILLEQECLTDTGVPLKGTDHIRVLAARYNGSGTKNKANMAFRFQPDLAKRAEYFDEDGKAVERPFLRAPFTKGAFRVSSRFNPHRFHPILRVYRPHHGTDYAAAIGTPVACIGKGVVVRAEYYKGYGNCVDVRHAGRYTSRYGHLSRIGVHRGQGVGQGQYIGNVGNSGLSTGPHLHFEMQVDGVQRNFLTMSFPSVGAVNAKDMPQFAKTRDELLARLTSKDLASTQ